MNLKLSLMCIYSPVVTLRCSCFTQYTHMNKLKQTYMIHIHILKPTCYCANMLKLRHMHECTNISLLKYCHIYTHVQIDIIAHKYTCSCICAHPHTHWYTYNSLTEMTYLASHVDIHIHTGSHIHSLKHALTLHLHEDYHIHSVTQMSMITNLLTTYSSYLYANSHTFTYPYCHKQELTHVDTSKQTCSRLPRSWQVTSNSEKKYSHTHTSIHSLIQVYLHSHITQKHTYTIIT